MKKNKIAPSEEDTFSLPGRVNDLKNSNYSIEFKIEDNMLTAEGLKKKYAPWQIHIPDSYRYEASGYSGGESTMLYAIETEDGFKGFLLNICDVHPNNLISNFISEVSQTKKI